MYVSILLFSARGNAISRFSGQADVERGFARDKVRLHSCYFSMQNFETTVADQGAVGMLFKGPLLFWGNAIKVYIDYTRYLFVMSNRTFITPPRATARVPTPALTMIMKGACLAAYHSKGGGGVEWGGDPCGRPRWGRRSLATLPRRVVCLCQLPAVALRGSPLPA